MPDTRIRLADIAPTTEAEGPGRRFAIWVQGCPLRCPGCCNPQMLPFAGGELVAAEDVLGQLEAAAAEYALEGITMLGGEPFAHAAGLSIVAHGAQRAGMSVMVFSGYTLDELQQSVEPAVARLLAATDVLVDGPYLDEQRTEHRRWIGSSNQRLHFLTDRYSPDDPRFAARNTVEIRWERGQLTWNGFPV